MQSDFVFRNCKCFRIGLGKLKNVKYVDSFDFMTGKTILIVLTKMHVNPNFSMHNLIFKLYIRTPKAIKTLLKE